MLKNGKEAIIVAVITGLFGILSTLIKGLPPYIGIIVFAGLMIVVYVFILRIKDGVGKPSSHPVFYTIDNGIKISFDYLPIKHDKKKRLVTLYIKTKYTKIRAVLLETIKDGQLEELPIRINSAISDTIESLKGKSPDIFLSKMSTWDNRYTSWINDTMGSIINSSYYADKNLKYSACFDCVQVMIKSTLIAVENSINEMNGELEKYLDGRNDI